MNVFSLIIVVMLGLCIVSTVFMLVVLIDMKIDSRTLWEMRNLMEQQDDEIKDDVLSRFAFYQYDDDTIYLSSLFVRESDRRNGYGSKVLKAAEEVAKTFGISKIRLKVERHTWMEEWYKKNGYEYLSSDGKYDWLEKQGEQKTADYSKPII